MTPILAETDWPTFALTASLSILGVIATVTLYALRATGETFRAELRHIAEAVTENTAEMKEHRSTQSRHGESLAEHGARLDGHDAELREIKDAANIYTHIKGKR